MFSQKKKSPSQGILNCITRRNIHSFFRADLLDSSLKVLTLHQIRDIILILIVLTILLSLTGLLLLQALVALGQFAERGEAVGAKLVEDAGDKFGEFLFFAVAVDGEGVGGDGSVNCPYTISIKKE